ncbi:MAG: hypothetical protein HPY51_14005 [Candidatus Omnitrophica bacterium]|nr:hypothetical protein [Candidatus Omnitrophota bacterium]
MNAPTFENLDLACAKVGKTIAETPSDDLHKVATDALAVLEEQGLYAIFLYLEKAVSGAKKKGLAKGISQELHKFLKVTPQQAPLLSDNADVFTSLQHMAQDLDRLLLARDLVRQALVYARYHARVPQESEVQT